MIDGVSQISAAAKRMRRHRERRRRGLSCIKVQLRRSKVDGFIACKLLEPTEREDRGLAAPLHWYSIATDCRTPTVTRNGERVACHGLIAGRQRLPSPNQALVAKGRGYPKALSDLAQA
jgi:hypothetical protein